MESESVDLNAAESELLLMESELIRVKLDLHIYIKIVLDLTFLLLQKYNENAYN